MKYFFLLVLWLGLVGVAFSQTETDAGQLERNSERTRIMTERQKIEATFKVEQSICFRKFFSNACLEKLQPPRSAALADLRRQEILMNDVERKINAADQLLKIEEKRSLQRQQQAEQEIKVQQDAANLVERSQQKAIIQGDAAEQAAGNKADMEAKLESSKSKAVELEIKRTQAAANVEATRSRQEKSSQRRIDREQRLRESGPTTGKSLPAYP
jgi:hypothetical protein